VANYIEAYQKYDLIKMKICNRIVICTTVQLAKVYVKRCNAKTSPKANTPLSFNSSIIPSELGFTELTEEATECKLHSRKGKKGVALTTITEDDMLHFLCLWTPMTLLYVCFLSDVIDCIICIAFNGAISHHTECPLIVLIVLLVDCTIFLSLPCFSITGH